jgi:predicted transcriptional regulator
MRADLATTRAGRSPRLTKNNFKTRNGQSKKVPATKKRIEVLPGSEELLKQMAVVLTVAGYDQRRIAQQLAVSQPTISRWLRQPEAEQYHRFLGEHLINGAILLLRTYAIEAVETLVDVMRTTASDKTRLDAAKAILDRIGLNRAVATGEQQSEPQAIPGPEDDPFMRQFANATPDIQQQVCVLLDEMELLLGEHKRN